jgi:hypothetical protein
MVMAFEIFTAVAASFFFFPLVLFGLLALSFCSERRRGIVALLISALLCALVAARYPWLVNELREAPWLAAVFLLPYFLVGALWSHFKWSLKVQKARATFLRLKAEYLSKHGLADDFFRASKAAETGDVNQDAVPPVDNERGAEVATEFGAETGTKPQVDGKAHYAAFVASVLRTMLEPAAAKEQVRDLPVSGIEIEALVARVKPRIADSKEEVLLWITYWPASMLWFAVLDFAAEVAEALFNRMRDRLQAMSDKAFSDVI